MIIEKEVNLYINDLVENNMGLVYSCVNRFKNKGIEYEELVQAGSLGILKAAKLFDEKKNFKFSTYAVPVILGEIRDLFRNRKSIKVSRNLQDLSQNIFAMNQKFLIENGKNATILELSKLLNISKESIIEAINSSLPVISLNYIREDNPDGCSHADIDIPVDSHEIKVIDILSLKQSIGNLGVQERQIIILRYFMNQTQSSTAKLLHLNQTKVSRLEKKILLKIKKELTT